MLKKFLPHLLQGTGIEVLQNNYNYDKVVHVCIQAADLKMLAWTPSIQNKISCDFPQYLQLNSRIVASDSDYHL
jgi:hypothetical protein